MNLLELAINNTAYNLWANMEFITWLKSKSAEVLEKQVPSSFPTIKQTLFHIWNTEDSWLARMQKRKGRFDYFYVFNDTNEILYGGLENQSSNLLQFVQSLDEKALSERFVFNIPYTGNFDLALAELVQHCINHSTYHRGQIVTMARAIGLTDPPMTDYILYRNPLNKQQQ